MILIYNTYVTNLQYIYIQYIYVHCLFRKINQTNKESKETGAVKIASTGKCKYGKCKYKTGIYAGMENASTENTSTSLWRL